MFDLPGKGLKNMSETSSNSGRPTEEQEKKRISVKLELVKDNSSPPTIARARLEALFDDNTFEEIGANVRHRSTDFGLEKKRPQGDGVITGSGDINGRVLFVFAQDRSVMGVSLGVAHAK